MNKMCPKGHAGYIDRRSFIRMAGFTSFGIALSGILPSQAKSLENAPDLKRASVTRLAMGTTVTMILIHLPDQKVHEAIEGAFGEIERLSDLMNHYKAGTEVSMLNRNGILPNASREVIEIISKALEYNSLTKGAFDITIYPVIELFRRSFARGKSGYPERERIREALELVGSGNIEIDGQCIRFKKKEMKITLDGIAKGYIVDRASDLLIKHGIERHLINAGGDIRAVGLRDDERPWRAAIQDPEKKDGHLDVIDLKDSAVATSGNYENYYDKDMLYHHIANPKTGLSPANASSASVIAPTALAADALATALMVMGPDRGTELIDSLAHHESLIITRDKKMRRSGGWISRR